jgi:prenyltransferase beta subunit
MLQVARLAPKQLGESRDLVAGFLRGHLNPDGGFRNRSGASDLYYTVFGLDGLVALQEPLPVEETARYLEGFGDGSDLDLVHLACLARAWASLRCQPEAGRIAGILKRVESFRTPDGGYDGLPDSPIGSAYGAFMALGIYQDLEQPLPDPERMLASLRAVRAQDGSYGIYPGLLSGITPITAAAVVVSKHLGGSADRDAGMWLLDRCHSSGGFFATPSAPVPDLLSTATALHALAAQHVPIGGIREACLDFVDSLWTNRGGFYGTWADDAPDCEYTFYALLALGHLSV